jgi:hypothetical protein
MQLLRLRAGFQKIRFYRQAGISSTWLPEIKPSIFSCLTPKAKKDSLIEGDFNSTGEAVKPLAKEILLKNFAFSRAEGESSIFFGK